MMKKLLLLLSITLLAAGPTASADFRHQLKTVADTSRGRVGVGVGVIETGEFEWLAPDGRFPMQSVYKFPIAMAVLAEVDAGKLKLDQKVTVRKAEFVSPGQRSPIRDAHPDGDFEMPLRELIRYAVSESDGTASDVLLRLAGGPRRVMAFLKSIGVTGVTVVDTELTLGKNDRAQYRNWATPRGAVELLKTFHAGKGLSPASRSVLLADLTESPTGPKRIKGMLPPGTVVAHKTGTSNTVSGITAATNDIGIVTLPDGRHLVVAVFVSDSPADEATREGVIARVARAAWERWKKG
jgi:beta-lactamase class A